MTLWEKTEADAELAFEVVVTLDDQLAFNRHLHALPSWRRSRANLIVACGVAIPLIALLVCVAIEWLATTMGAGLDEVLGDNGRAKLFMTVIASLAAAAIAVGVGLYWLRRHNLEASLRAKLAARPSINPADPALAERYAFAIHAMGFRASTDCAAHAYAWTVIQRFEETADHMFLMIEHVFGFIVPKRDLDPATTLALRRTMQEFQAAKAAAPAQREA